MMRNWLIAGLAGVLCFGTIVALPSGGVAVAQTVDARKAEAERFLQQGIQQYQVSQFTAALQSWQQALKLYREIKDRQREGIAQGNLGTAYRSLGNYAKAIEYYEQSLAIVREIKDRKSEGNALDNLGTTYLLLGNYAKAIKFQEQSLAIAREIKDRQGEGSALGNLGNAYDGLGNYVKAIEYYEQSLAIAREIKDRREEGNALGNLGLAYDGLGNYAKAIEYYEQILAIAREIKSRREEGTALGNLGIAYRSLGNYAKAIEYYEQSLAIAREIKNRRGEGQSLVTLGNAYFSLGNYAKAIEYYEQSLAISREIKDRDGERLALNNLAAALEKLDQPDLAIVFYKQSVIVSETVRKDNRSLSRDLQSSYTESVAFTYRNLADLLLSQGRVLEAQQVLELLKNQELRDFTRDTRTGGDTQGSPLNPLEQPIPFAYNDKIALGSQLTECEQQKCAQRNQLISQRDTANQKFTTLVDRLKTSLRAQTIQDPAQLQNDRFTIAAQKVILANPNTKTVLVYPLVLDDKLWLVWGSQAGKSGIVFDSKEIPVTRKDLSAKVAELQTLLSQRGDKQQLQQASQQLYQWLIAPIRPQLDQNGVKQIVFSLDRATRYIPMATLHDGKQYLIENFAISTILTAEIDTTDKLSQNRADDPILGLGLTQAVPGFNALPAVTTEIDSIIRSTDNPKDPNGIYPGRELFDQNFTEDALRFNVADYRILHIATHGSFVPGNPEDSFLVLGDGKKLSIPSIRSLTALANTHLVVLSACETGKGGIDKEGIEVAGIGHYFLLSGAKSVLASLWLVNDPATSLLMREFYGKLAKGNISKAEAIRQVQIDFLKGKLTAQDAPIRAGARPLVEGSNHNDFTHPYYWAPFILIGNNL
ncbi:MAG: hypothetical protein RLZZ511_4037 [Cyanobacteriota bacterium]|jgi:CHAT domain-containing protein/tetratricopeptide (TPR) repeat protein